MTDCVFCKIASKEIPSEIVYEDDMIVSFKDLEPQAPVHVLIVPKKHIKSLSEATEQDKAVISHIMVDVVAQLAKKFKIASDGFRVVVNTGKMGGQTVPHLHFHLLGGRDMQWPPG